MRRAFIGIAVLLSSFCPFLAWPDNSEVGLKLEEAPRSQFIEDGLVIPKRTLLSSYDFLSSNSTDEEAEDEQEEEAFNRTIGWVNIIGGTLQIILGATVVSDAAGSVAQDYAWMMYAGGGLSVASGVIGLLDPQEKAWGYVGFIGMLPLLLLLGSASEESP